MKFAGTHLYTWVERGTVRVKCLAQEHNTMSPARAQTGTNQSGDERTNHEAIAPSNKPMTLRIFWNKIEISNYCRKARIDLKVATQDFGIKPGGRINTWNAEPAWCWWELISNPDLTLFDAEMLLLRFILKSPLSSKSTFVYIYFPVIPATYSDMRNKSKARNRALLPVRMLEIERYQISLLPGHGRSGFKIRWEPGYEGLNLAYAIYAKYS